MLGLAPPRGFSGPKWPRVLDMLRISHLLAGFIGPLAIALALPLEDRVNNAFVRGTYTAEVCVWPHLTT